MATESNESSLKAKAIGAGMTAGVFGLLMAGGVAGWSANNAMHHDHTPSTVLSSSSGPTATTVAALVAPEKP